MRGGAAPGRLALLAALLLAAGRPASAGPVEQAKTAVFTGLSPSLGYTEIGENTNRWMVTVVYDLSRTPSSVRFVARRTGGGARTFGTTWADSRTCPALVERLRSLPQLSARFLAPEVLQRSPSVLLVLDGTDFTLWSRGLTLTPASSATVEITQNYGPVADWGHATDVSLEGCWSPTPPEAAR